jgi:hypothetical protein
MRIRGVRCAVTTPRTHTFCIILNVQALQLYLCIVLYCGDITLAHDRVSIWANAVLAMQLTDIRCAVDPEPLTICMLHQTSLLFRSWGIPSVWLYGRHGSHQNNASGEAFTDANTARITPLHAEHTARLAVRAWPGMEGSTASCWLTQGYHR